MSSVVKTKSGWSLGAETTVNLCVSRTCCPTKYKFTSTNSRPVTVFFRTNSSSYFATFPLSQALDQIAVAKHVEIHGVGLRVESEAVMAVLFPDCICNDPFETMLADLR